MREVGLRETRIREEPSWAKRWAIARPMPRDEPVIRAFLPVSRLVWVEYGFEEWSLESEDLERGLSEVWIFGESRVRILVVSR